MNRTNDTKAVAAVMHQYTNATRARDISGLKSIFHENSVMSGYLGPQMLVGSAEPFFQFVAANDVAPEFTTDIVNITVSGHAASATLVEDNLFGMSFVNYFHLVRQEDGRWIITAKLFHHDAP